MTTTRIIKLYCKPDYIENLRVPNNSTLIDSYPCKDNSKYLTFVYEVQEKK